MSMRYLDPDFRDVQILRNCALKPCPFCGGSPATSNKVNDATGIYRTEVICSQCMASIGANLKSRDEARERAIEKWQKRK